jgi:hypothetical protein
MNGVKMLGRMSEKTSLPTGARRWRSANMENESRLTMSDAKGSSWCCEERQIREWLVGPRGRQRKKLYDRTKEGR